MMPIFPIILSGNLGERHRQLNSLVNDAYEQGISFQTIRDLPEQSPIDRLFKIDLASKFKDVEYTLDNLKDEDMLYVSRALKTTWLLDSTYSNIINPLYLEEKLYPEMTTNAVNKMKHWIHLNLSESKRSEEFYEYYSKDFDTAIKFLGNCSNEFVLSKIFDVLEKLTPHHLKVLSEKCPEVAEIYFDNLKNNEQLLSNYLTQQKEYCSSLKVILKLNSDIYLNIIEKYFCTNIDKLSPAATKYIMSNHKNRFTNKPELYSAWFFDMTSLAKCLNTDEIKEIVLKLARAEYLASWFSYQAVEPLIKSLNVEDRTALKQQVFVDKSVGDKVKKWPYEPPSAPEMSYPKRNIFQDNEHDPDEYTDLDELCIQRPAMKRLIKKKKYASWKYCDIQTQAMRMSSLDRLFDRFRFTSYANTLSALKREMTVENVKNRQNMMLVLVSKSGGHPESVEELLNLLTSRYENEPMNLRATIVRSLVRRCCAWRLPEHSWDLFLKFGRDLGLDGKPTSADCKEGLHAVMLRKILEEKYDATVWEAFLEDFTYFSEYSLNSAERKAVSKRLPELLLSDTGDVDQKIARLHRILETLSEYKIPVDQCSGLVEAIKAVASNPDAKPLLYGLFYARIARKELFRQNFAIMNNDKSFLNALKHDIDVLDSVERIEELIESDELNHDCFMRKLALYYNEKNGLADKYLSVLEKHATESPKKEFARPLAFLGGRKLMALIQKLDASPKRSLQKRFATNLKSNAHLARPLFDLETPGWKFMGAKAVANRVITCSAVNVDRNMQKLVSWRQTARLAFVLSMRIGKEHSVLATIGEKRPKFAVKTALFHLRQKSLDSRIWDVILPLIEKLDPCDNKLNKSLSNVKIVPSGIKAEYCVKVYELLSKKDSKNAAFPMLCNIQLMLPEVDEGFIERILVHFINNEFTLENVSKNGKMHFTGVCLYMITIAKYLLLSKSERTQQNRMRNVGEPFFRQMEDVLKNSKLKSDITSYLDEFLKSLKYTKVFLDTSYVSCMPVFESVIKWMQDFLPLDKYFGKYANVHLTMLYFKSVRQSIKNNPAVFEDLPNKLNDCVSIVGHIFGMYIAHETTELIRKYFESVKVLYKSDVVNYLNDNFDYNDSKKIFILSIVKGILECEGQAHLVAEHIAAKVFCSDEMSDILKGCKTQEMKFFLYAK